MACDTVSRMAKVDDTTEARLKELAQAEMTRTKERLAKRTTAARDFATATAKIEAAATTWERIQGEAIVAKASAVTALIDSEMKPAEVAQLLGIDAKELRTIRAVAPSEAEAKTDKPKEPASPASVPQGGASNAA
jgi:hypothetical protein